MKKITTSAGVFGPYGTVEVLADRYRADGADLPFTVVGSGAVSEWTDPLPTPQVAAAPVPASVSPRQIRQSLTRTGLRATVEAAVAASDQDTKDWWERASVFERSHPLLAAMAAALGITNDQVDAVFRTAAQL